MIGGVCLFDLVLYVRERITRNTHDIERMIYRIQSPYHDGVGIVADNVNARGEYRIHSGLSAVDRIYGRLIAVMDTILIAVGRVHEILNINIGRREKHNKAQKDYKDDLTGLAGLFLRRGIHSLK